MVFTIFPFSPLVRCRPVERTKRSWYCSRPVLYTPVRHPTNGRKRNFNFPRSVTAHLVFTKIKKPARCIMYFAMWRTTTFASGLFDFAETHPIDFRWYSGLIFAVVQISRKILRLGRLAAAVRRCLFCLYQSVTWENAVMGPKATERLLPIANFCLYQGNYYNTRESVDYVSLKDTDGIVGNQGDESLDD